MTDTKPIVRGMSVGGSLRERVDVVCKIAFTPLAEAELTTICLLIEYSVNNQIALTPDIGKQIRSGAVSESSFSTSLHRLEKKKVITRSGRTIIITPLLKDISSWDKLVISFV